MEHAVEQKNNDNKMKGWIISFGVHALLLLLCLLPFIQDIPEDPPLSGIVVALGNPDGGNLAEKYANVTEEDLEEDLPTEDQPSASEEVSSDTPEEDNSNADPVKNEAANDLEAATDVAPVQANNNSTTNQKSEAEKKAEEEAEKRRRAAEEKARKEAQEKAEREAREKELEESKSQFSDLFGQGQGNGGQEGNQGNPDGDPDSDVLDKLSTGSGRIGGGISDRGVIYEPKIQDNSQKTGKVVVKVCVDKQGNVTEANFTQRGSTTTDKYLIDLAEKGAFKYRFTPSDVETQCGNITIDFKVK